jgi:transposase
MARFPSAGHLASWAGMCPGSFESAGQRKGGKTRQGSKWLRRALTKAARAAARTTSTYLAVQYRRLAGRRGPKRAAIAVGHTILTTSYHLLSRADTYHDLSPTYFDHRLRTHARERAIDQLQRLGYQVTITPRHQLPS